MDSQATTKTKSKAEEEEKKRRDSFEEYQSFLFYIPPHTQKQSQSKK